jgi:hypothetical protein
MMSDVLDLFGSVLGLISKISFYYFFSVGLG